MKLKKGPWTVVDTKELYSNPWISVREDKVIRPDGKEGIFGIVTMRPGVSILPIDQSGNVYLIEQYRYTVERKTIEVASGGIDDREDVMAAAKRELKEETGITAKKWISLGVVDPLTAVVSSPNYLFLAKELTLGKANPEGTENIKLIKVPLEQAVRWVNGGTITHSVSATLILKTKDYLISPRAAVNAQ